MAAVSVVSGGFWITYGGDWQDYLKLGFIPFAILVPSRLWNYSEPLALMTALFYWLVLLAIIYVAPVDKQGMLSASGKRIFGMQLSIVMKTFKPHAGLKKGAVK